MDSYAAAENMGIQLKKQWLATLDGRTRHAHQALDGQVQKREDPFQSELGDIMYPGDPSAHPANVYNCRCTLIANIEGDYSDSSKRWTSEIDPATGKHIFVENMAYSEWIKTQEGKIEKPKEKAFEVWNAYTMKLQNSSIKYNQVAKLSKKLTDNEIIDKIAGGDKTGGSCASAALAYCANKHGFDVLDFRGGESTDFFSKTANLKKLFNDIGISYIKETTFKTELANAKKVLKNVQIGKEYYMIAGGHAAIVRAQQNSLLQYLELQSPIQTNNGWKNMYGSGTSYKNLDSFLKYRFNCSSSSRYVPDAYIFDINQKQFKSDEFRTILGFINTPKSEQKKGINGKIK